MLEKGNYIVDIRRVNLTGNSYGVTLNKNFVHALRLRRGDFITVTLDKDCIIIRPLRDYMNNKDLQMNLPEHDIAP